MPWNIMAAVGAWTTRGTDLLTRNVPTAFERLLAQPRLTDFQRLMAQNVKKKPIPNIIVTAQRSTMLQALQRANIGLTLSSIFGQLGASVMRDVSQRRLEERYAWLMAPQHLEQIWRTPLQVQQPATIPEIIVTGQRPAPSVPSWSRLTLPLWVFDNFRVPLNIRAPRTQTQFEIEPPNVPRPTRTTTPQLPTVPLPVTQPFPGRSGGGMGLTRVGTRVLPSRQVRPRPRPQTQTLMQGYCPPAPKCTETEKRKKMRTVCWRKLVKEKRDPAKDKEYKWERIDCDTGRPIPSILQKLGV